MLCFMVHLTHRVMHIFASKICYDGFRYWIVAWSAQSHYLNQCCIKFSWIHGNKIEWHLNQNRIIFRKNRSGYAICKTAQRIYGILIVCTYTLAQYPSTLSGNLAAEIHYVRALHVYAAFVLYCIAFCPGGFHDSGYQALYTSPWIRTGF